VNPDEPAAPGDDDRLMTITTHHTRRIAAVLLGTLVLSAGAVDAVSAAGTTSARSVAPRTVQTTTPVARPVGN
jgi:hypothetical protein